MEGMIDAFQPPDGGDVAARSSSSSDIDCSVGRGPPCSCR